MQNSLPSRQKGLRPVPELKSRLQTLDRRYSRACAGFKRLYKPGIERIDRFVSVAIGIGNEVTCLETELGMSKAAILEMKEKRQAFEAFIAAGVNSKEVARESFAEKYGCVPETCFHEYHLLGDEIMRLEGPKPGLRQKIKSVFEKKK